MAESIYTAALILTSALHEGEWLTPPTSLSPGNKPGTLQIGGWVRPTAGFDLSEMTKIYFPFRDKNSRRSSS
jgi:hypothetical protein